MTRKEIRKMLRIIEIEYQSAFKDMTESDMVLKLNLWESQFSPYEKDIVLKAFYNCIAKSEFAPKISSIFEEMNKLETSGDEEQAYWEQLAKLCRRASAVTREEFEALPEPLKKWLRNLQNLKELGQLDADIFNSVTRGQFFREIKPIVESEKAKERVQHIALAQQKLNFLGE